MLLLLIICLVLLIFNIFKFKKRKRAKEYEKNDFDLYKYFNEDWKGFENRQILLSPNETVILKLLLSENGK